MRMKVVKNGKDYRCDFCQKLLAVEEVCFWRSPVFEVKHFCTRTHKRKYITENFNARIFKTDSNQMTGSVIPVKNGATNQ